MLGLKMCHEEWEHWKKKFPGHVIYPAKFTLNFINWNAYLVQREKINKHFFALVFIHKNEYVSFTLRHADIETYLTDLIEWERLRDDFPEVNYESEDEAERKHVMDNGCLKVSLICNVGLCPSVCHD